MRKSNLVVASYYACVQAQEFWGQVRDKTRLSAGITQWFSIAPNVQYLRRVGKQWVETLTFSTFVPSFPPSILNQITDVVSKLSTISTGPITITTIINIYSKEISRTWKNERQLRTGQDRQGRYVDTFGAGYVSNVVNGRHSFPYGSSTLDKVS